MKRVLVPLAEGFEELEAVTIIDVLRRAGLEVVVASLGSSPVTGSHGIRIAADTPLAALAEQDFDMIALPGGMPGADHLKKDPRITEIVQRLHGNGRPVAAICAAPMVLASAGILDGRRATSYPGFLADAAKTTVVGDAVVVDRGVITSRGPGTALDFALALVEDTRRARPAPVDRIAPRARKDRHRVTEAVDKARPEIVREDEHASIVQSLARVDWLVLSRRRALCAHAAGAGRVVAAPVRGNRGLHAFRRRFPLAGIPGAGDGFAHRARRGGHGHVHHFRRDADRRIRRARW